MNESHRKPRIRRHAGEVARRLDALCNEFERSTARAYELRGPAFSDLCTDMRRFWNVRDRLRVNLFAAKGCQPESAAHVRERIDEDWTRAQRIAERTQTHIEAARN